jgi:hypothetical protein
MFETARVIAEPAEKASGLWDQEKQATNRFREIEQLTHLVQLRIERGYFPEAQKGLQAIRELASEGRQLGGAR